MRVVDPNYRRRKMRDLSGKTFGRYTVLNFSHRKGAHYYWTCQCSCDKIKTLESSGLLSGSVLSCGCLRDETASKFHRRHGESRFKCKEYTTWENMRNRCSKTAKVTKKTKMYKNISICERWNVYENFLEDMGRSPSPKHSIDRIDNKGNYEPGNCRWATRKEQANNQSTTIRFTIDGQTKSLGDWCDYFGVKKATVNRRIKYGWSLDELFSKASPNRPKKYSIAGSKETKTVK